MISIIIEIILGIAIIGVTAKTIFFEDWRSERFESFAGVFLCAAIISFMEGHWVIGIILCVIMLVLGGFGYNYEENGDKLAIPGSKILGTIAIISLIVAIITFYNGRWGWGIIFSAITILFLILWFIYHAIRVVVAGAALIVSAAYELIKGVIDEIINKISLTNYIKQNCPKAFRYKIIEAKKNAVNVGIFNSPYQKETSEVHELRSDYGIDRNEIYEGETIELIV